MSSLTIEVETSRSENKHKKLARWVEEVAQMTKPDRIHRCDGSPEEYQATLRLMILSGTAIVLDEKKRPGSFLVRSHPADTPIVHIAPRRARHAPDDTADLRLPEPGHPADAAPARRVKAVTGTTRQAARRRLPSRMKSRSALGSRHGAVLHRDGSDVTRVSTFLESRAVH